MNGTRMWMGIALCCAAAHVAAQSPGSYAWLAGRQPADTIERRVPPPPGYVRTALAEASFGAWLRGLPLEDGRPAVHLFDGRDKVNQEAHAAVIDIDVGGRDLQQCADAVIRLRAEWQYSHGRREAIRFRLTNGSQAAWDAWARGERPVAGAGQTLRWVTSGAADDSYPNFRRYLERVFVYAGSASLAQELDPVPPGAAIRAGDVFIRGGYPGHAVIVVDTADHPAGDRVFLLAQSYMPAQDAHVLVNPGAPATSPWYSSAFGGRLVTPEWVFARRELRRFP